MIVSLNEIESLTLKTCRGVGMSWGLAEEAAQAARWLARHSIAWDRSLVMLLSHYTETAPPVLTGQSLVSSRDGAPLCPIHSGTAIADLLDGGDRWTADDVLQPVWLVPLILSRRSQQPQLILRASDETLSLTSGQIAGPLLRLSRVDRIARIHVEPGPPNAASIDEGVLESAARRVDADAWAKLEGYAAFTYVPASLQSRISGAGAGVSDND